MNWMTPRWIIIYEFIVSKGRQFETLYGFIVSQGSQFEILYGFIVPEGRQFEIYKDDQAWHAAETCSA